MSTASHGHSFLFKSYVIAALKTKTRQATVYISRFSQFYPLLIKGIRPRTSSHVALRSPHPRVVSDGSRSGNLPQERVAAGQVDALYQCNDLRRTG